MASGRFTLYDFFVDIVPGAVSLLILFSLLPFDYDVTSTISEAGLLQGVVFLIISYVLGHFIQATASPLDERFTKWEPWLAKEAGLPYPFEHQLEREDDTNGTSVVKEVEEELENFFDSGLSGKELFFATQSYLWNNDIGRMRRFQRLYTFFRGLYPLLLMGGLLHWAALLLSPNRYYRSIWSVPELGIIGFLLVLLAGIAYRRRVKSHEDMAKAMIYDFYSNVLHHKP